MLYQRDVYLPNVSFVSNTWVTALFKQTVVVNIVCTAYCGSKRISPSCSMTYPLQYTVFCPQKLPVDSMQQQISLDLFERSFQYVCMNMLRPLQITKNDNHFVVVPKDQYTNITKDSLSSRTEDIKDICIFREYLMANSRRWSLLSTDNSARFESRFSMALCSALQMWITVIIENDQQNKQPLG